MDDLGLFCLYLRYFPSYQVRSLSIRKLRLWGFWKYVSFFEKHWPGPSISQNKKSTQKVSFSMCTQKNRKIPVQMKIYNFKIFIFEFSKLFWYVCFFYLWKTVEKNRFYSQNNIFCTFIFNIFWWMTLDCFACISVIFQAINFVR